MSGDPIEVLLVDGNPAESDLFRSQMRAATYLNRVTVVDTGTEALMFLRKEGAFSDSPTPDLVILDLNLPGCPGREVLKEIKTSPLLSSLPVIVLTSSEAENDIIQSHAMRADAYLQKPSDLAGYRSIVFAIDVFWLGLVRYQSR